QLPVKTKEAYSGTYVLDKVDIKDEKATWYDNESDNKYSIEADSKDDFMYTEWGSEVKAHEDRLEIKVPTSQRKLRFFLGKPAKAEESASYIEGKVGDTVKIGEYEVKIEDIEGVAKIEGEYYEKVADFDPIGITVLDNEAGNGNLIVVGGWNANEIAERIRQANPEIEQELESDKVIVNKYTLDGQEIILVAGWEAEDTRNAAKAFVQFLREQFQ
ncbi:MAG TPA: S-layer protein, partial [Euryarchaeota archaeon]|nr:S-layer protein [Euryarchaeota archaeon]